MKNIFSLILILSILILIIKYIIDLKANRYLMIILIFIGIANLSYLLSHFLSVKFTSIGLIAGIIISPLLFIIYLLKGDENKNVQKVKTLMLIPSTGIFISYLSKSMHWPGAATINLVMIVPILFGIYLVFKSTQLEETKVMQIFLIILSIDFMHFVVKLF